MYIQFRTPGYMYMVFKMGLLTIAWYLCDGTNLTLIVHFIFE